MAEKKQKNIGLVYKGHPLVRSGKTLYLGNPSDSHIAMLQIMSESEQYSMGMAEKVAIQIISTDSELPMQKRIIKRSDKNGLYLALDIAVIWLERAISEKK